MPTDDNFSITPLKTRENQRRSTSEKHVHSQQRTPSLQDKPFPDLSPPPPESAFNPGINRAPSKSGAAITASPVKPRNSGRESGEMGDFC